MPKSSKRTQSSTRSSSLVFQRWNYILMAAGVLAVVLGFALMRIENELHGFISLYVAPIIILGGYAEIIYAIMWRGDESSTPDAS